MKTVTTKELTWSPLSDYTGIDKIKINKDEPGSGVYIWGFYLSHNFIPYMVGKAKGGPYSNIKNRLWSHLSSLMGGDYAIHKKENLEKFYNFKGKGKENDLAYIPRSDKDGFTSFVKDRYGKLKEHIDEMVNYFHFTYAIADSDKVADLEKSVIEIIGQEKLWNTRVGTPKEFEAKREDLEREPGKWFWQ